MDTNGLLGILRSLLTENLSVSPVNGGLQMRLPFNDSAGEPVEMFVSFTPDAGLVLDDLGHTAGLLFHLAQHTEDTPGYLLLKNLADLYDLNMDYNRGILTQQLSSLDQSHAILNFIKVLITCQTAIPAMEPRKKRVGRKRLSARLGREIKQLRFPEHVQRVAEVEGKYETWIADYKYVHVIDQQPKDVIIVAADLEQREPREKAAHVLALAYDVLALERKPSLRVVYELNGNGSSQAVSKAADLIECYQKEIGYSAFNYADAEQRNALNALTIQELSPLIAKSRR